MLLLLLQVVSLLLVCTSSSHAFGRCSLPSLQRRPAFVSPSRRSTQTAAQAKARLDAYSKAAEITDATPILHSSPASEDASIVSSSSSSSTSTSTSTTAVKAPKENPNVKVTSSDGSDKDQVLAVSDLPPRDNVLYYCACLVGGIPGKLYLTPYVICFVYGVLGITNVKEMLPLNKLESVIAPDKEASLLSANTLKLTFFAGSRVLFISPIMVECLRLRSVLMDAKEAFTAFSAVNEERNFKLPQQKLS